MSAIGERLRAARSAAKLTQKQLHKASGVSQQMISKLESGKSDATSSVVQLASALGVSPNWLATGEGEPILNVAEEHPDYAQLKSEFDLLTPETRAMLMISMGRDPDEPLPKELTESIRRMLDAIQDMIRQARNNKI